MGEEGGWRGRALGSHVAQSPCQCDPSSKFAAKRKFCAASSSAEFSNREWRDAQMLKANEARGSRKSLAGSSHWNCAQRGSAFARRHALVAGADLGFARRSHSQTSPRARGLSCDIWSWCGGHVP